MKKFNFITEKTSDGYSAYCETSDGGIIATTGDTLSDLKANALEASNLMLLHTNKKQVQAEAIGLIIDLPQFFDYYKLINTTQLAQRLKINRSLLSQYVSGTKKPSPLQTQRILKEVKQVGKELAEIEFV